MRSGPNPYRIITQAVLAAFVVARMGAELHSFEHSRDAGAACGSGTKIECGGCASTSHHHHAPLHPESAACRICSATAMGLPALTLREECALLSSPTQISPAEVLPEQQGLSQICERGPPSH